MDPWLMAVIAAFAPAVAWLLFFYTRDTHEREPLRSVLIFFGLGGLLAIPLALILIPFIVAPVVEGLGIATNDLIGVFIVFFLLAGVPEESIKAGVAVFQGRREVDLDEPADGMIYFTSVGLGFGAVETTLYIAGAYTQLLPYLGDALSFQATLEAVIVPRAIGATVAHGVWSGIVGYFYARRRFGGQTGNWILPGIGTAAATHALFNTFANTDFLIALGILVATAVVYFVLLGRALDASPHRHLLRPTRQVSAQAVESDADRT